MLRWEPVLDSTNYHVFRNGVKIAETLGSTFFNEAPPTHVFHYKVVRADDQKVVGPTDWSETERKMRKADLHAIAYGMGERKFVT